MNSTPLIANPVGHVQQRKIESSHQRHNRQHNDGKFTSQDFLLGTPVKSSNAIAANTTIKLTYTGGLTGIQTGCLGAGEQSLTVLKS